MDPVRRQAFVLGLGAQKAGTTWLADHLKKSPEYATGFRKEFHVFDCLDLESERWMLRSQRRTRDRLAAGHAGR